ncbi:hypothetical protein [Brevibacillus daliensis]|uniref:hypothetical protein n=1 Tax=Brevibacillus daliensis TaxID=2892995 RepID=UPI001E623DBC|nr:hypothetical protein [Brevibacillus daliensis]
MEYYSTYVSQSAFVKAVKGKVINETATKTGLIKGLEYFGLSASKKNSSLTFGEIKSQLYNKDS